MIKHIKGIASFRLKYVAEFQNSEHEKESGTEDELNENWHLNVMGTS